MALRIFQVGAGAFPPLNHAFPIASIEIPGTSAVIPNKKTLRVVFVGGLDSDSGIISL